MDVYEESLDLEPVGQRIRITQTVYQGHTGLQEIHVLDTLAYGRALALDGIVQTTERDEFIYHEMIAQVPMLSHAAAGGGAKRVLIIGGGDGGSLEEVLKHPVERVTLVELDPQVVEICRRHLPKICGLAFDDPRTEVIIGDGADYVAESSEQFDVIIIDSTDPIGPGEILFGDEFYGHCRDRLADGGVIVTQAGIPFTGGLPIQAGFHRLSKAFGGARGYITAIPSYVGGLQLFGWASPDEVDPTPAEATLQTLVDTLELKCQCYSPAIHRAAFVLPPYLEDFLA